MKFYAIFDSEAGLYIGKSPPQAARGKKEPHKAAFYKRLGAAIDLASLWNTTRNIPPGHTGPSKHYSNRPQVEVHEFDHMWNHLATHAALPQYISITTG